MDSSKKYENPDNSQEEADVKEYRQRRVDGFKLNINSDSEDQEVKASKPKIADSADSFDEITSFSDESTKAQIARDSKRELKRQKQEEKKISSIKSARNKKVYRFAWLAMVIVTSIVIGQFLILGCNDFLAANRSDSQTEIIKIETGESVSSIAKKLEKKHVIDSATFFSLFCNVTNQIESVEPGIYQIPKNKDYLGIVNYLEYTGNRQNTITLQITEGTNVIELVDELYAAGITTDREEFIRLCNSDEFDEEYTFLKEIEMTDERVYKLEGYLFPDTYEFYLDEDPVITIKRFLSNFETRVFEAEYEFADEDAPMTLIDKVDKCGYTLDEVVTIASLIQGEAKDEEDMYKVSSVIYNRLSFGVSQDIHSLGLDSTLYYPYKSAEDVPEEIRDTFKSAYGTYDTTGLPPGAICSPSAQALCAAASPADTDYLYFCHGTDDEGNVTAYYATTFYEHQNNIMLAGLS